MAPVSGSISLKMVSREERLRIQLYGFHLPRRSRVAPPLPWLRCGQVLDWLLDLLSCATKANLRGSPVLVARLATKRPRRVGFGSTRWRGVPDGQGGLGAAQ